MPICPVNRIPIHEGVFFWLQHTDRYYTDLSMNTTYRENGKVISIKEPKTEQREIMSSVYSRQFVKRLPLG